MVRIVIKRVLTIPLLLAFFFMLLLLFFFKGWDSLDREIEKRLLERSLVVLKL